MRTSTVPVGWAAPLARVFNNKTEIYVLLEMKNRWEIPHLLRDDMPEKRMICIEEVHGYYGEFINSIGCMTPTGNLDEDPITWSLTQQVALP
jgi:hypothetical protein